jgi:site-specific DNA-methyltransferase (adenine-specific)
VSLSPGTIHQGDCLKLLAKMEEGSVDLAFADPPFNIGYKYDVYEDRQSYDDFCSWSEQWMGAVHRVLKPSGTFWLAIGDEFAAELKVIARRNLGFTCRSWVIWYYTFGVNCKKKFNRSHVHLFHFVKDPKNFTFNTMDPAVRVQSARSLVYGDSRANPDGRMPDDTWILRPQDVPDGFSADQDTWFFSRVAGTFKERMGFHGCQMPEQLLGRIIRVSSNPGTETSEPDLVLDPFSGSGTTVTVAKKLGRRWIGLELSKDYRTKALERVNGCREGEPLVGPEDPVKSAPPTRLGRRLDDKRAGRPKRNGNKAVNGNGSREPRRESLNRGLPSNHQNAQPEPSNKANGVEQERAVIEAYTKVHEGVSVDWLLSDPSLNAVYLSECRNLGLTLSGKECNRLLLGLRKAGKLPIKVRRRLSFTDDIFDQIAFASEIAMNTMQVDEELSLDDVLCDPSLGQRFDSLAFGFAPGFSAVQYRWGALRLRKRASDFKKDALQLPRRLKKEPVPQLEPWSTIAFDKLSDRPGVYVLHDGPRCVYVGGTADLGRRLRAQAELRKTESWKNYSLHGAHILPLEKTEIDDTHGLQSLWIKQLKPLLNWRKLSA